MKTIKHFKPVNEGNSTGVTFTDGTSRVYDMPYHNFKYRLEDFLWENTPKAEAFKELTKEEQDSLGNRFNFGE